MAVVVMGRHTVAGVPVGVGKALTEAGLTIGSIAPDGDAEPTDLSGVEGLIVLATPRSPATAEHTLLREALAAEGQAAAYDKRLSPGCDCGRGAGRWTSGAVPGGSCRRCGRRSGRRAG
ncbi:hypothetical protein [Streptomyces sp. NBC_00250]|uniref:hypothetical protein n=1 Tax=Streptomyces sp. NBC_00250 TaxID=2903641 RepID=UPI003FA7E4FD